MTTTTTLLLASGNADKLRELRELCADLPLTVRGPEDLPGGLPTVEETGSTFTANAILKARAAAAAAASVWPGAWALADDSGLCVDALDGEPGVRSARFAGVEGPERDAANNALLLERLAGVPPERRGAVFRCALVVADAERIVAAVGQGVRGRILEAPEGEGGFGYDPLFYHEGLGATFAALTPEEKAAVSHRGVAMRSLREVLAGLLGVEERPAP